MLVVNLTLAPDDVPRMREAAARQLRIAENAIRFLNVERRSIDARRGVKLNYTLRVDAGEAETRILRRGLAQPYREVVPEALVFGDNTLPHRPLIVGAGPAGIMAAWKLAKEGYRPIVLEQGRDVARRAKDTEKFFTSGELNPLSNVQFGEGGAGAFSDGKLNTRVRDPRCAQVLSLWAKLLDAPELSTDARPHVGTDRLHILLPRIRQEIEALGGTFLFDTQVTGLVIREGVLSGVQLASGEALPAEALILAPGHSARDLQESLLGSGLTLEARPFAMGVRCEQPQEWLDRLQYGSYAGHPELGAASYSVNAKIGEVSVHSFCVCPGGEVVNASSEVGHLCVNGMSHAARASGTLNGALVVTVTPPQGADPLWGVAYQRRLEKAAFDLGGGSYFAPAQNLEDFLKNRPSTRFSGLVPSVRPGAVPCDLQQLLGDELALPLRQALADFERRLPGFTAPGGVLTAVEARTSSPVRLPRDRDSGQSPELPGLFPCGEGAGYAGGILSSAVDGFAQAERLMRHFARPKGE